VNVKRTVSGLSVFLAAVGLHAEAAQPATRNRAEIPAQYRWDFSAIYPGWEAWEAGMKDLEAKMDAFAALKGSLSQGPAPLLRAYRALDEIGILQYRVYRYPQLQRDTDTREQDVAGKFQRVGALFAKFGTITAWFTPELLRIPQATVEQWIRETPALAPYRFPILEDFRKQKHVLDEQGEKLLSFATRSNATPRAIYTELSTSDIKYPTVKLADGSEVVVSPANYFRVLRTRYEQGDRARAFEAHLGTYAATANTYAAIYDGVLQRGWFTAQARNFATTLDAGLEGTIAYLAMEYVAAENCSVPATTATSSFAACQASETEDAVTVAADRLVGPPGGTVSDLSSPIVVESKTVLVSAATASTASDVGETVTLTNS